MTKPSSRVSLLEYLAVMVSLAIGFDASGDYCYDCPCSGYFNFASGFVPCVCDGVVSRCCSTR